MNPPDATPCKRCGAMVPASSNAPLCPACLLSGALEHSADGDATLTLASGGMSARHEISEFPSEFGGYKVLGLLGRGGMGTVYEAEQLATGRRVALKLLGQQLDSPDLRQRFLREGRLAAGINHPNSLYIFGSEEIEGLPAITMEIAGSGTLKDKLDQRGPLPVADAVDAILDVIAGLEAAFAGGVLHRDVKPSNCFVSPDGSVKVGDFGLSVSTLAKDDSYATATGVIMGTPAFAPPEQLRGDDLDVRADIYSVGATLFTLLTGQAPFEGKNAVQVVTHVVGQKPPSVGQLREDVPPGLQRVVARCLSKEAEGRYDDYMELRDALLPFSSREAEPASMTARAAAGWIDFLIAFLVPYVILMLFVGNEQFHLGMFIERSLASARYHVAFLAFGLLYFGIAEGFRGAGFGKQLKGLQVIRKDGRPPGFGRALTRILMPVLCVEGVRIPLLLASISATAIDDMTTFEIVAYSTATALCPWIPIVPALIARRENGFATAWDLVSGTRVVVRRKSSARPSILARFEPEVATEAAGELGPYRFVRELIPGSWIVAIDPVLRRPVWLLRRVSAELPRARRQLARPGRLRWLQRVEMSQATWDAFEAPRGEPFSELIAGGKRLPWGTLRHWLHDLASELWLASGDRTLPAMVSLDHVWITAQGQAVLLDEPWPEVRSPAERLPVGEVTAQQRFLSDVAACVDTTGLPLHARPVLRNLKQGKFEKLSFLTGILGGLLEKPAEVGKGVRAGSIFLVPCFIWVMLFVGTFSGEGALPDALGGSPGRLLLTTTLLALIASALMDLLVLPLRTSTGHSIFRLAVVATPGEPAGGAGLLRRWAIVWLPVLPVLLAIVLLKLTGAVALAAAAVVLVPWIGAAVGTVLRPDRGLADRWSGSWVVRR